MNILGKEGERIAKEFLKKKGYSILHGNYRTPFGGIDIIARRKRCSCLCGGQDKDGFDLWIPFRGGETEEKEKIRKVALFFMKSLKKECPAGFDVLSINVEDGREKIEHIRDAFEV